MAAIVISGSGRGAGKTAVGCALIAAIPEFSWVAVKVTPHLHGLQDALREETELESAKDTGRYLRAGARRSYLVSTPQTLTGYGALLREVWRSVPEASVWLVESGGIEREIREEIAGPVVSLAVVAGDPAEWKPSLALRLASVEALVLSEGFLNEQLSPQFCGKRSFRLAEGEWVTEELVAFVRERLRS